MSKESNYLKKELYALIKTDESIFDFIQESSLDGLWYWDLENPENEWMNAKFWTVLGYNPEEMPHKSSSWQQIINQNDLKVATENFVTHCKNPNHPYDQIVRYTHKNGSIIWIHCRGLAIRNENGKPIRMLGAHHDISEIKQSELEYINAKEKAEENEEKYRALYNNAPLSYQSLDENGCFIDINPMWLKTLGYTRSEVIGKWYGDFLHPDYVEHFRTNFPAFKERGYISDIQFKLRKKENTFIYVSFEGCIGYTADGKFKQTYCVFKDITEQKALENDLLIAKEKAEESEILKNKLVANIGDVIVIIDHEGNNRYKSPNVEKLFGWKPEELTGRNAFEKIHPDDIEQARIFINSLLSEPNKNGTIEVRYRHKNGNYVWIKFTGSNLLHDPVINGILGNYHDISERKNAEIELSKAREKANRYTEMILSSQSVANICSYSTNLIEADLDKSAWECSPEFYKIFGMDETYPHTIEGWAGFIHPDFRKEIVAYHESVVKNKTSFNKEYKIIRINDGAERWVHGTGELVYDEQGNPVRMHGAIQDITEIKKTEEDLIKAKEKAEEANRLKTKFLNNMSHEIRTPMNGIIGFSEMLDSPDLSEEKRRYYSKIVQNSSHQLLRIIDDILEISTLETKQEKLNETEFCLNDLLMELFSIFNLKTKQRNIPLYLKKALHDEQSFIFSDNSKLNKIISNLLENALKFTNEGYIEFGYFMEKENIILYVKDTGVGISPGNHEMIFERFSQEDKEISSKHGGLGLGLSICKENAQLLGGSITLESEKGKGSTFFVTIPRKPLQITNNNAKESIKDTEKAGDRYTILIAEDEEVNFLFLEVLFETEREENFTLIHAKNGKEAVEICTSNSSINIVLMDIKMPIMNGHEAAQRIKQKFPQLPVIAQTAYSTEKDKQLALKYGCDDFISKPINKKILFGLINKYLKVYNSLYN